MAAALMGNLVPWAEEEERQLGTSGTDQPEGQSISSMISAESSAAPSLDPDGDGRLMTINFLHRDGRLMPLPVRPTNTVLEVWKLIRKAYESQGAPPGYSYCPGGGTQLELSYGGQKLNQIGKTMASYGIRDGQIVRIQLKAPERAPEPFRQNVPSIWSQVYVSGAHAPERTRWHGA